MSRIEQLARELLTEYLTTELVPGLQQLPSGNRGELVSPDDISTEVIDEISKVETDKLKWFDSSMGLLRTIYDLCIGTAKEGDPLSRALRLWVHDANNFYNFAYSGAMNLGALLKKDTTGFEVEKLERHNRIIQVNATPALEGFEKLRVFGLAMGYLVSKDPSFIERDIDTDFLLYLTGGSDSNQTELADLQVPLISNLESVALSQLVKNADKRKFSFKVSTRVEGDYNVLVVEDYGTGLVEKGGTSLSLDQVPKIFGDYSTSGGGLGLQIVRDLAHSQDGYVEVESKTEDGTSISYRTDQEQAQEVELEREVGCTFSVYMKRE